MKYNGEEEQMNMKNTYKWKYSYSGSEEEEERDKECGWNEVKIPDRKSRSVALNHFATNTWQEI